MTHEDEIQAAIFRAYDFYKLGVMSKSISGSLYLLFSRINTDQANLFFDGVYSGIGLYRGDPMLTLRESLMSDARQKVTIPLRETWAKTVRAWNHFRKGQKLMNAKGTMEKNGIIIGPEIE